jgi:hypothetical protein
MPYGDFMVIIVRLNVKNGCRAATELYNPDGAEVEQREKSYHYAEISSRLLMPYS